MDYTNNFQCLQSLNSEGVIKMEEGVKEELEDPVPQGLCRIKMEEELELEAGEEGDMNNSTVDPLAYPRDCYFSCQYCDFETPASNVLKEHILQRREEQCPISCSQCTFSCREQSSLREHLHYWHGEEPPSSSADWSPASRRHSSGLSTDRTYSCPHCDYTTLESFNLKKHIQTNHSNHCFYSCPHCEYSCVLIVSLKRHIRTCHSNNRPNSRRTYGDLLTSVKSIDFKKHTSLHCEYPSVHSSTLTRHNQEHHSKYRPLSSPDPVFRQPSYVQTVCSQADRQEDDCTQPGKRPFDEKLTWPCLSSLPSTITDKLAVHTDLFKSKGIQKGKTPLKEVTASSALKKYQRRSETASVASKRFPCDVCQARFTDRSNLRTHQRTHTKEKPYTCDVCSASFSRSYHLKTHMRSHTGEKPYTCDVCSASFSRSYHLKTHIRSHTGEKPHTCDVCSARFAQLSHLRRHQKSVHK